MNTEKEKLDIGTLRNVLFNINRGGGSPIVTVMGAGRTFDPIRGVWIEILWADTDEKMMGSITIDEYYNILKEVSKEGRMSHER